MTGPGALELAATAILAIVLLVGSAIDLREQRLPDGLTLCAAALGLLLSLTRGSEALLWAASGAAIGFGSLWLVREVYLKTSGQDGLGLGDVKLLAAAGAWLGPLLLAPLVLIAATSGLLAVGMMRLTGHPVSLSSRIPFGPFLALGFASCWAAKLLGLV